MNHFTPVRIVLRNEAISSAAKGLIAARIYLMRFAFIVAVSRSLVFIIERARARRRGRG